MRTIANPVSSQQPSHDTRLPQSVRTAAVIVVTLVALVTPVAPSALTASVALAPHTTKQVAHQPEPLCPGAGSPCPHVPAQVAAK
jgi:hypothetical protein